MIDLQGLASYTKIRNVVDGEISGTIGRPSRAGHTGEYVAAAIFDIELEANANHTTLDGQFRSGSVARRSVNVEFGTRKNGMMNLVASTDAQQHPDYYLVLTGSGMGTVSAKGLGAPWVIRQVLLFESADLLSQLAVKGVKLGVGTRVSSTLWKAATIYPEPRNPTLTLTMQQQKALRLF